MKSPKYYRSFLTHAALLLGFGLSASQQVLAAPGDHVIYDAEYISTGPFSMPFDGSMDIVNWSWTYANLTNEFTVPNAVQDIFFGENSPVGTSWSDTNEDSADMSGNGSTERFELSLVDLTTGYYSIAFYWPAFSINGNPYASSQTKVVISSTDETDNVTVVEEAFELNQEMSSFELNQTLPASPSDGWYVIPEEFFYHEGSSGPFSIEVTNENGVAIVDAIRVTEVFNPDSDNDDLPDVWENLYWPGDLEGEEHGKHGDPDGDHLDNYGEYLANVEAGFELFNPTVNEPDQDLDALPDEWEVAHFGDLSLGANDDPDGDNFDNLTEYHLETDPNTTTVDADGDGVPDHLDSDVGAGVTKSSKNTISLSPTAQHFGNAATGLATCTDSTETKTFTVANITDAAQTLGSVSVAGLNSAVFATSNDNCSGASLPVESDLEGEELNHTCTFNVSFCPVSDDTSYSAYVTVSAGSETLSAALFNQEGLLEQAKRRVPPVLSGFDILGATTSPEGSLELLEGSTYTLQFNLVGYDDNYQLTFVAFDCSDESNFADCGVHIGSMDYYHGGFVGPKGAKDAAWTYDNPLFTNSAQATTYSFEFDWTVPSNFVEADGHAVIRLYYKSGDDIESGNTSLSLIATGAEGVKHFDTDTSGRRLQVKIINQP